MTLLSLFFNLTGKFTVFGAMFLALTYLFAKFVPKVFRKKKSFNNKIVLITGGANGLGKILVRKFLELGSTVIFWDIDEKGGESTMKEFRKKFDDDGKRLFFYKVDLSKREYISKAAERVRNEIGHPTVLINNAGIVAKKTIFDINPKMAELVLDVNLRAHFWTVREFVPHMIKVDEGHVCSIASAAGLLGVAGMQTYCASKFGAVGFCESLRNEFERNGNKIDTTTVCPLYMKSAMFSNVKAPWLFPLLDMESVAQKTVEGMQYKAKELIFPWYTRQVLYFGKLFFPEFADGFQKFCGVANSMDDMVIKEKST